MGKNPRKWILDEEHELEVVGWEDKLKQQQGDNILCVLCSPPPPPVLSLLKRLSLYCPLGLYLEELFSHS